MYYELRIPTQRILSAKEIAQRISKIFLLKNWFPKLRMEASAEEDVVTFHSISSEKNKMSGRIILRDFLAICCIQIATKKELADDSSEKIMMGWELEYDLTNAFE